MPSSLTKNIMLSTALAVGTALVGISPAIADNNVDTIITDGNFFGEVRYRYETVDQGGVANDAEASTVRTNIGFKTGEYKNVQGLIEAQFVKKIGGGNYNSTTNGDTDYPIVADPDTSEINQAWLTYTGIPDTLIRVGRQGINLDNQRFVGTVAWRQNDQTFDAALLSNTSIEGLALNYAFVSNVNRIQGDDHANGDLDTETHIFNGTYNFSDALKATAYGYLLDIDLTPTLSSETYGVRLTGDIPLNDAWTLSYEAEAAEQSDYGNNTDNYDENYYHISPAFKGNGWVFQAGYEVLGGNGTTSFQTPLATGHKFNGWADKFLNTPDNGLEDSYAKIAYKFSNTDSFLDNVKVAAIYHEFEGNESADYGSETNLLIKKSFKIPEMGFTKGGHILLKYADYDAEDAPYTDTEKLWLQVGIKF